MCHCMANRDNHLRSGNSEIPKVLFFDDRSPRVIVTTKKIAKGPKRIKNLVADYCPFCGEKYDD